jgi:processive 1,2-diacylglycerol beta-glucosyltransferase
MITQPKKILCVSVSAGAGHVRAAEAMVAALQAKGYEALHLDMMNYMSSPYKAMVRSYSVLIKQAPSVWGLIYHSTNKDDEHPQFSKLTNRLADLNASKFLAAVKQFSPDHVIGTHYLPVQAITMHREELGLKTPTSLILTDYDKHSLLLSASVDQYFVATEKMKFKLVESGIPENHVAVSGIPIDPIFYESFDQVALKEAHGYDGQTPVYLTLSGGLGTVNLKKVVETLFRLPHKATIIAVAGTNAALAKELALLTPPPHIRYTAFGWTNSLHTYMKMADVVITKPGGLTTTECIALKKPMIAIQPIPGQEEHNAEYILEQGYGVVARSLADLLYYMTYEKDTIGQGYQKNTDPEIQSSETIISHLGL